MKNSKRPADKQGKLTFPDKNGKFQSIIIHTHDVPKYFTEENLFFLNFWARYKEFGNPWEIGWTQWPYWAIRVLEICNHTNRVLNGNS